MTCCHMLSRSGPMIQGLQRVQAGQLEDIIIGPDTCHGRTTMRRGGAGYPPARLHRYVRHVSNCGACTTRRPTALLPSVRRCPHAPPMFAVTEAEAAAIRAAFDAGGEFSAAVELRRIFPGITDNARARECARIVAGWAPIKVAPQPISQRRRTKI